MLIDRVDQNREKDQPQKVDQNQALKVHLDVKKVKKLILIKFILK